MALIACDHPPPSAAATQEALSAIHENLRELDALPPALVARLRHYFETYKLEPGGNPVRIAESYGRERAWRVLAAAQADYEAEFVSP